MMRLVLRKILIRMTLMHSVIAVNTLTRKLLLFILEQETITQVQADLQVGILIQEN